MLSLYHLSTLIGALDVFMLAVAREVGGDFVHFVLPRAAFVFVRTIHFHFFNITVDLLVSECRECTRILAFGIWTALRVRSWRFATSLEARLQAGAAENVTAAITQVGVPAGQATQRTS